MKSKILLAAIVLLLAVTATGCWDRVEIDSIGIIGSLGLDNGENGKVIVSLEVINPGSLAIGVGGGAADSAVAAYVLRDEASTISNAIANAQRRVPRTLSTGQVNTVICGQALAREGIGQYIDFLIRDAGIRRSAILTTCDTGSGLLQRPYMDPIPSRTLSGLAKSAVVGGKTTTVTLNEFCVKLAEPGVEPITMHTVGRRTKDVLVKKQGEEVKQKEPAVMLEQPIDADVDLPSELPSDSPVLDPLKEAGSGEMMPGITVDIGIAAYRNDKLVGLMDGVEARGYLWTTGKLEQAVVEVPDPNASGQMVGLDVIRSSASVKAVLEDEIRMEIKLHIDLEGSQVPLGTNLRDPEIIKSLEESLNELIMRESKFTLKKVQEEMRSDIYGFGNLVYKSDPRLWAKLEPRWNDEIFPRLRVDLEVHSRVRGPGAAYGLGDH